MIYLTDPKKIFDASVLNLKWFQKNAMVPLPYLVSPEIIRLFTTFCDDENIGRIGYVDVLAKNPKEIVNLSESPLIDIGAPGTFSDNGVVTSSIFIEEGNLYLFYSGYQLGHKVPYTVFPGVAFSCNSGLSFKNLTQRTPLLDRVPAEVFTRSSPQVLKTKDGYAIWYQGDVDDGWVDNQGKLTHSYELKRIFSDNLTIWPNAAGQTAMSLSYDGEFGITRGSIWQSNSIYRMLYSSRKLGKAYTISYAESQNGFDFYPAAKKININFSKSNWDNEMQAFPALCRTNYGDYVFYSGNAYGLGGVGFFKYSEQNND